MKEIKIKGGKGIKAPALLVNPQSKLEGEILRETNVIYPTSSGGIGLENIDGIVSYLKDWVDVASGLKLNQTSFSANRPLSDRILIILPELEFLIKGVKEERQKMYDVKVRGSKLFDSRLTEKIEQIVELDPSTNKRTDSMINELYPLIDTQLIAKLLRFQLENNVSILTMPTVPIISQRQLDSQFDKATTMINESNTILENVFTAFHDKIDTMNILTITASVLKSENYTKIFSILLNNSPNHVGIRIINVNPSNDNQIINIFNTLLAFYNTMRESGKNIPIHLLGLDHLSYIGWTYGMSTTTLPIVQDPYYFGKRGGDQPPKPYNGAYYDPEDRTFYTKDVLYTKTRSANFRLPCYCDICKKFETIPKVPDTYWNEFRRIHTLLIRSTELKMVREARAPINIALREMFLRSKKLGWTQFLPDRAIVAF